MVVFYSPQTVFKDDYIEEFVESIQTEGVELERRSMGEGTPAIAPLIIEVDNNNKNLTNNRNMKM